MADYILDLRKVVGYRPLIQTGAGVIVVDTAGRILLQRRSDNGCWDYAGGSGRGSRGDRLPENILPLSRKPLERWMAERNA